MKVPLISWEKSSDGLDVWRATRGNWRLSVQPDSNGNWQWCAENLSGGFHINEVRGTSWEQQTAMDRAVRWTTNHR
jgi:hypothetical protein